MTEITSAADVNFSAAPSLRQFILGLTDQGSFQFSFPAGSQSFPRLQPRQSRSLTHSSQSTLEIIADSFH